MSFNWENIEALSLTQLKEACSKHGISVDGKLTKSRLVDALKDYQKKNNKTPKNNFNNKNTNLGSIKVSTTPLAGQQTPKRSEEVLSTPVAIETPYVEKVRQVSPLVTSRAETPVLSSKGKPLNWPIFITTVLLFIVSLTVALMSK